MTVAIFDPDAKREFLDSMAYYEENRSGLGSRFKKTVESAVVDICDHPFRYRTMRKGVKGSGLCLTQLYKDLYLSQKPKWVI